VVKRIAIALDYSGSMSGTKIRSAVENILSLFDDQIQPQDQIMLLHFNYQIVTDVHPFTSKEGHEEEIRSIIQSLTRPSHGTALYDAMSECIRCMSGTAPVPGSGGGNDWIVVLTDGEDTGSKISKEAIQKSLSQGAYGVIVIGVGADVNHTELEKLTLCNPRGFYVKASGDKEGITRAFGQVRNLMQENIVFEDI
jgi:Mg-chelatase subunit ChlD